MLVTSFFNIGFWIICLGFAQLTLAQNHFEGKHPIEGHEKQKLLHPAIEELETRLHTSPVFSNHFTGFALYDLSNDEWVVRYQSDKYYTPASNVKLFTALVALETYDSNYHLPTFAYSATSTQLTIRPLGDPTFLHPAFEYQPVFDWLSAQTQTEIIMEFPETELPRYGTGWMWDDYYSPYQPELSWFPIYGNQVRFSYHRNSLKAIPALFNSLSVLKPVTDMRYNRVRRKEDQNWFVSEIGTWNGSFNNKQVPFIYSPELAVHLLSDTLGKQVQLQTSRHALTDTLHGIMLKDVLAKMLINSDNFLAEQLLVQCMTHQGFKKGSDFRYYAIEKWLSPVADPQWYDASGMSRYNLASPEDFVGVLRHLHKTYGWQFVKDILPAGGVNGTLRNYFANTSEFDDQVQFEPYIFAKSGTLKNNYCLSGYLEAKSGKVFVFSFMNNNFRMKSKDLRLAMQDFLEQVRDQL